MDSLKRIAVVLLNDMVQKCSQCTRGFLSARECMLHELKHIQPLSRTSKHYTNYIQKPFKCDSCDAKFALWSTLEKHSILHKPFPHICHCGIGYYQEKDLYSHKLLVHKEDQFVPKNKIKNDKQKPNNLFTNLQNLVKREKESESDEVFDDSNDEGEECNYSENQYSSPHINKKKSKLKHKLKTYPNDVVVHKGPDGFECPHCPMIFKTLKAITDHYRDHVEEYPYTCEICSKPFLRKMSYCNHKFRCHSKKPFKLQCSYCPKKFRSKSSLTTHVYTHTGEKPHKCKQCGKGFAQSGARDLHEERHLNLKQYQCKTCQKGFNNRGGLSVHERIHENLRQFKCSYCSKDFNDQSAHKRHERIHNSDYMYKCELCTKPFTDYSAYITHKRRHDLNNRKYKCDQCPRLFFDKWARLKHYKAKHDKVKELTCRICSKEFTRKNILNNHLITVHGQMKYQCDICKWKTLVRFHLFWHIQKHYIKKLDENGKTVTVLKEVNYYY